MLKLKGLLNELENGIELNLMNDINPGDYRTKEKKVVQVIAGFQKELLSQLFSMQVVESQIKESSGQIMETLDMEKQTSAAMFLSSQKLNQVNDESIEKVTNSLDTARSISDSTNRLKNSASELTVTTEKAKETVEDQVEEVYKIIDMVGNVSRTSKHTIQSIDELGEGINKISEILKTVQNFYKKTKLLSLNASIESARAGEAGKGFSVVAMEIGNLAEGSAESVEEIVGIMKNIDAYIVKVTENSANENKQIKEAVEKAEKVNEGLSIITRSFMHIEDKLVAMNRDLESNSQLTNDLNEVLADTKDVFSKVTEEIEEMNDHISSQHQHSKKIMDIEVIFKDIATSLNNITLGYQMDILTQVKTRVADKSIVIIEELEKGINQDLIDELEGVSGNSANKSVLDKLMNEREYIEAIWTNTVKGDFVYSMPPAGIKNASIRNWFHQGLKGKAFVSEIYISGISKKPCITISIPLLENKVVKGILGVDVSIDHL